MLYFKSGQGDEAADSTDSTVRQGEATPYRFKVNPLYFLETFDHFVQQTGCCCFPSFSYRDDLLLRSLGLHLSASAGRIGFGVRRREPQVV